MATGKSGKQALFSSKNTCQQSTRRAFEINETYKTQMIELLTDEEAFIVVEAIDTAT